MKFIDAADMPDSLAEVRADTVRGLQFHAADRSWIVTASDKGPAPEWYVWQRLVPGDGRRAPHGYVRRLAGMRMPTREMAEFFAGLLDDLPATGSLDVALAPVRLAVRDARARISAAARDARTRLAVAAVQRVARWAEAARRDVERDEDQRLGPDLPDGGAP